MITKSGLIQTFMPLLLKVNSCCLWIKESYLYFRLELLLSGILRFLLASYFLCGFSSQSLQWCKCHQLISIRSTYTQHKGNDAFHWTAQCDLTALKNRVILCRKIFCFLVQTRLKYLLYTIFLSHSVNKWLLRIDCVIFIST